MKLNQRIYKTFRDSKVNLSSFLQEFKQSIKVMDTSTNVDDTAEACHHDHAQWWPVANRYCTFTHNLQYYMFYDIEYKEGWFEGTRLRRGDSLRLLWQALPSDVHQIFLPPDCCLLRVSRCYVGVQEMCHVYTTGQGSPRLTAHHKYASVFCIPLLGIPVYSHRLCGLHCTFWTK